MAFYTETELEAIAGWLKDGLSASKISDRLSALRGSGVSRNAVIGIVHRNAGLSAIGFANPGGGRSGGRPRKAAARPCARQAGSSGQAELPGQAKLPGQVRAVVAKPLKSANPVKSVRLAPPVWLLPRQVGLDFGVPAPVRPKAPTPRPVVAGRQPHVAAMRFIDCLFDRCRAPLDPALEEDPENDAPGARPGPDMLCCGLLTPPLKSYCAHHAARFYDHRRTALADAAAKA
ncbi:GcrA cell cycle regulator [Mesorhizobium sp. YC-39]|uniref:GcrA family cell cycle regulator n=1 Tax=unclassified Mesorhizobium TaxID=325217 RepID=UPI0021E94373|nr:MULTISPECIES: GcrA family cell cycle regulator [unclassified Mesorhizobium]MCV3209407.1 GcrA cell cycle regulator [Mesorhizobium sp. YC-2]MCV3231243.1 GcrA cell cycle regulator [Mesorhizobium sp. YC-39]